MILIFLYKFDPEDHFCFIKFSGKFIDHWMGFYIYRYPSMLIFVVEKNHEFFNTDDLSSTKQFGHDTFISVNDLAQLEECITVVGAILILLRWMQSPIFQTSSLLLFHQKRGCSKIHLSSFTENKLFTLYSG